MLITQLTKALVMTFMYLGIGIIFKSDAINLGLFASIGTLLYGITASILFQITNIVMSYAISLIFKDTQAARMISNVFILFFSLTVCGALIKQVFSSYDTQESTSQIILGYFNLAFPLNTLAKIYYFHIYTYNPDGSSLLYIGLFLLQGLGYACFATFMNTFFSRQSGVSQTLGGMFSKSNPVQDADGSIIQDSFGQQTETKLLIEGVQKRYGKFYALDGVSCEIHSDVVTCILGHNGAGKTTLINAICGINPPTTGEIYLNGANVYSNPAILNGKVGYCTAQDVLYEDMTLCEFLRFIAFLKGVKDVSKHIQKVMKKCDLIPHASTLVKHLSGGTRRRTSIASAVVAGPKIVIMDEPSSGVDPENRRQLWSLIESLKSRSSVLILTTHHLEEAEYLSKDVIIMDRGKIEVRGTPDEITQKFGIGYRVIIEGVKDKAHMNQVFERIQGKINEAGASAGITDFIVDESNLETQGKITFVVPIKQKENMGAILRGISDSELRFDIESNSLEEAFVNLGEEKSKSAQEEELNRRAQVYEQLFEKKYSTSIFRVHLALLYRRLTLFFYSPTQIVLFAFIVMIPGLVNWFFQKDLTLTNVYFFGVIIILVYNFTCSFFAHLPFDERKSRMRYILKMLGVDSINYYLNMFITDMIFMSLLLSMTYGFLFLIYIGNYKFVDPNSPNFKFDKNVLLDVYAVLLLWGASFITLSKSNFPQNSKNLFFSRLYISVRPQG